MPRTGPSCCKNYQRRGFDKLASADGGFYIYADVSELTNDSAAFCKAMLTETGVAATPGADFDPDRGHLFVRFSFARDHADMGLKRQSALLHGAINKAASPESHAAL